MRLDKFAAEKYGSRSRAAAAIGRGSVLVNGVPRQASYEVKDGDRVEYAEESVNFVSAGGYKLFKALCDFSFDVGGKVFADIGASTGGFTDCLLKAGARKVYCIDVGESQLDGSLLCRNVVVIDNFNARNLTADLFGEPLDGVTIDVSFISLTYILGAVSSVLGDGGVVLALVKPQFECESRSVGKNGIVRGADRHMAILKKIYDFAVGCGLAPVKLTVAPERRGKNLEYVALLVKGARPAGFNELVCDVKL